MIGRVALSKAWTGKAAFAMTSVTALGLGSCGRCLATRSDDGENISGGTANTLTSLSSVPLDHSSIIPMFEASCRAFRLSKTVCLMMMDYELAKVREFPPFRHEGTNELLLLEREIEHRSKQLEIAQSEYASGPPASNDMSEEERKTLRIQQKQDMEEAARKLANAEANLSGRESQSPRKKAHLRAAGRLLELCRQNGGVYIKIGQHLANLDYLLPNEYISTLSSLFDEAPRSEYVDVCQVIEEDLNDTVGNLFNDFDPTPIASASLAQVHTAYDKKTGKKLAVKVQHRGLRETSVGDIWAVTCAVRVVDALFEEFTFGWIVDEIAPQLPKELDFRREGTNAERASADLKKTGLDCVVPKVLWKHTASRILTMEFEEGFKVTDIPSIEASGLKRRDIAYLVSSVFNSQIFLAGFTHCDPHPANVLVRNKNGKPQMVLVDHGLYKELDSDFRIRYAELWKALMMADLKGIRESCLRLGVKDAYPLFASMLTARPYDEIKERSETGSFHATKRAGGEADKAVIRGYAQRYLKDIVVLLGTLPQQMLLLLKMNDCLRHIDFALGSPANNLVVAGRYAATAIYEEQHNDRALSWSRRLRSFVGYIKILFRIQMYEIGIWITQQIPTSTGLPLTKSESC